MDLTDAEDIKKRWQEYKEELCRKDLSDPDNHDGVITHLKPDILECKVKWALGSISSVQFSRSVVSDSATPWITACQASLSITNSRSSLKLMSIELVMPSSHLILCRPLLLPASGSFPMSQLFAWGGQSIGVSASAPVLPMNTQDWSPLGWTSWISLQSKGLSRVFSNTTVQKHQFPCTQLSL